MTTKMNCLRTYENYSAKASCSTCPPGGNQVDGLPPARNTGGDMELVDRPGGKRRKQKNGV